MGGEEERGEGNKGGRLRSRRTDCGGGKRSGRRVGWERRGALW